MSLLKNPCHPGEVLQELYLKPTGMSAINLARRLNVPRTRIERLVRQETALSVDTAIRLAKFYSTSPEYWINLQRSFDLSEAIDVLDLSEITPLSVA
ncbi:MAG: HigA family addiction module antitoxin [Gammaproteobacteria bacterium]|nr:HigA family addiction module antitoxin [Gammaproteobacteria bacterium]MCY4227349.1 HigA family addiction module antitoxin [Gammaproteobacteria bacterium]MCY4312170.1 HigA family addiction module antitoxin [Gammaproteobacteria bacterium]